MYLLGRGGGGKGRPATRSVLSSTLTCSQYKVSDAQAGGLGWGGVKQNRFKMQFEVM